MLVKIFIININPNETIGRKHFENIVPFNDIIPYRITTLIHIRVSIPLKAKKLLIAILKNVVIIINPINNPLSLSRVNFDE